MKNDEIIRIRLPSGMKAALETYAEDNDVTVSQIIRRLVKRSLIDTPPPRPRNPTTTQGDRSDVEMAVGKLNRAQRRAK